MTDELDKAIKKTREATKKDIEIARLRKALEPFAQHVGKSGSVVTLQIGKDTWTGTLTTDDFEEAYEACHSDNPTYQEWKKKNGLTPS